MECGRDILIDNVTAKYNIGRMNSRRARIKQKQIPIISLLAVHQWSTYKLVLSNH